MSKHIYSFFNNEQTCIQSILDIHNDGNDIDLDPMYNQGMFYKDTVAIPKLRFDLDAERKGYNATQGDATDLPIKDESVHCMILDPPFMFGSHGQTKNNRINKRYTMFDSFEDLKKCYIGIIREAYRVLSKNGILIFKCQDYTDNRSTMTHCLVWLWAVQNGFYAKDIAILNLPKSKIYNGSLQQRHLRKTHCYFWVFQKATCDKHTKKEISDIEIDIFKPNKSDYSWLDELLAKEKV